MQMRTSASYQRESRKVARRLFLLQMVLPIANAFYVPYLSLYYALNGMGDMEIGILSAIPFVISIFMQPLWGRACDRAKHRKRVVGFAILGASVSVLLYLVGSAFWLYVAASTVLAIFHTALIPLVDSITMELVANYQLDYGRFRWAGSASYGLLAYALAGTLQRNPTSSFPLAAAGYLLLLAVWSIVPTPCVVKTPATTQQPYLRIKISMEMGILLGLMMLISIGTAFANSFYGVYCVRIGFDRQMIGLSTLFGVAAQIPVSLIANRINQRFAERKILIFCLGLMALRMVCMLLGQEVGLILSQVLFGVTFMLSHYCIVVYMSRMVDTQHRNSAQSLQSAVRACGSVLGTLLGGMLSQWFGIQQTLTWFAVASFVLVLLTTLLKRK